MQKFTEEEQQAIMAKVNPSNLCDSAKLILEMACGAWRVRCKCGNNVGLNKDGETNFIFHGDCEIKDRKKKEQVEKEINESGIATATFRPMTPKPGYIQVGYHIKVNFLNGCT
jgi:hypothetical protein